MKPNPIRMGARGSIRGMGQIATVAVLGGLTLVARPWEASPTAARGWPPRLAAKVPGVLLREVRARSTDRCLVPVAPETLYPGFLVQTPEVDPGMVVTPGVVGLRVASARPGRNP